MDWKAFRGTPGERTKESLLVLLIWVAAMGATLFARRRWGMDIPLAAYGAAAFANLGLLIRKLVLSYR